MLDALGQLVFAPRTLICFLADQEASHARVIQAAIYQFLQCGLSLGFRIFPQRSIVETRFRCWFKLSGIADNFRIHDVGVIETEKHSARHSHQPFALLMMSTTVSMRCLLSDASASSAKSG